MTDPKNTPTGSSEASASPTLARIQEMHPVNSWNLPAYMTALESAITALDSKIECLHTNWRLAESELADARFHQHRWAEQFHEAEADNARLREQLAEADENMIAILADQTWSADIYHAALARQEQRRKEGE